MAIYCLFCQTAMAEGICCQLRLLLADDPGLEVLYPRRELTQRRQGKLKHIQEPLLPGYIFLFLSEPLTAYSTFRQVRGIIRLLGTAEDGYMLLNADAAFAEDLRRKNGLVKTVKVVRVGDEVQLADEMFAGHNGKVIHMDGRKQRAQIEFVLGTTVMTTWISVEDITVQNRQAEASTEAADSTGKPVN